MENYISLVTPLNVLKESPLLSLGVLAVGATSLLTQKLSYKPVIKTISYYISLMVMFVIVCLMIFYRKPANSIRYDLNGGDIVSPAFGTVYEILPVIREIQNDSSFSVTSSNTSPVNYTHISIYLSPADIHVQYIPTESRFVRTTYDPTGKFELAYELNKSNDNEKAITELLPVPVATEGGTITIPPIFVTQIAGYMVRRINTRQYDKGSLVKAGQELGMIKFGSRVDIEIPTDYYDLNVQKDQYLYGFNSKIANIKPGLTSKNMK